MGYVKEGGATHHFPDDTENEIWIEAGTVGTISDLHQRILEKWPDVNVMDLEIEFVNHHQYCIYYDLYDSSDYVKYYVISK